MSNKFFSDFDGVFRIEGFIDEVAGRWTLDNKNIPAIQWRFISFVFLPERPRARACR